jgi:hypothetical protein
LHVGCAEISKFDPKQRKDRPNMPNADSLAAIAQLNLIQTVDDGRAATETFKLTAWLRTQLDLDTAALEKADADTALTESDRAGGSAAARGALTKLEDYVKEGFKFIDAIRAAKITDAQRLEVFTAYGWAGGKIGRFNDARVIGLSRLAVLPHADLSADFRYPSDLVTDITAQLAILDANVVAATGGNREVATKVRDAKLDAANVTLARVRFYYCSASTDTDQTPELAKINFQPRRDSGTVQHTAKPAPAAMPAPTPKPA